MKRVPIIVMLAMSPAMLNSDVSAKAITINPEQLTEVVANAPVEATDEMIESFSEIQETQQSYPLGVAYFKDLKVQQIKPAIGNQVRANLVLTGFLRSGAKDVEDIYYIKHSYRNNNSYQRPPVVQGLVYHDIGEKSYLGIILSEELYNNERSVISRARMESEVKLDDESAQFLLDFRTNDTKWSNKTNITFSETKNPNVMPPKVY